VRAHTVFVSGATGFIASHIVSQLLEAGHHVRGSVRNMSRSESTAHLRALPRADTHLQLVEADLLAPHAFEGLLAGCDIVIHTASPYVLEVANPQRDLVDTAVQGTRSMLEACARTPGIGRVILTSSVTAMTDEPDNHHVLTEADWNTRSTLDRNPYFLSKTMAEREAWAFVEAHRPAWDLVVINPFLVIGPSLSRALNTSNKVIADLLNGVYPAILGITWGIVDVRDVATAHIRAMDARSAHGRYLCAAGLFSAHQVVALLRSNGYDNYRLPRINLDHPVGHLLAKLAAYGQSRGVRQYLLTHLGRVPRFDNSKIRSDLAMTFRPVDQSLLETAADLVMRGHARSRRPDDTVR
jgi:dihydroflavonol-4-reductase